MHRIISMLKIFVAHPIFFETHMSHFRVAEFDFPDVTSLFVSITYLND